jgi:hypothetical protein
MKPSREIDAHPGLAPTSIALCHEATADASSSTPLERVIRQYLAPLATITIAMYNTIHVILMPDLV